ncbi:MAG: YraN family protein [Cyclobacteriaceae bacterium]|nr:YraN family protein [Cytophagales bacterium]MBX2899337.1 YraN family protein [Cyclobacteriaceae bacterium]
MSDKIQKGKEAEDLAAAFLVKQGYEIVQRNYRYKRSEIDLIVRKAGWLIFVEVKMRSSVAFGYPEEFVDYQKAKNIVTGAEQYTYDNKYNGNVRYDVVAITIRNGTPDIRHFEDAFY